MKLPRSLATAVIALGLIGLGAGLENLRHRTRNLDPEPLSPAELPELPKVVTDDPAVNSSLKALRHRIAELERMLAQRNAAAELSSEPVAVEVTTDEGRRDRSRRPDRESRNQRMERMREENPEAYAEMQQRRAEMRQHIEQDFRNRADFLTSLDTRSMSSAQRENHEQLLTALARFDELRSIMEQGTDEMEREERDALRQEMWENTMALGELYETERATLFGQAAAAAGYQGAEAEAFVGFLEQAIQSTTMAPGGMGMRGGPGGGPGGFGGGPGGGFGGGGGRGR